MTEGQPVTQFFSTLLNLGFAVLVIYALVQSNNAVVEGSCGPLWRWMLARTIIAVPEMIFVLCMLFLATSSVCSGAPFRARTWSVLVVRGV